jgi:hypothetical protein
MRTRCRNPRCGDALPCAEWFSLCASCRLALKTGIATGVGLCATIGFLFGVLDWLVRL